MAIIEPAHRTTLFLIAMALIGDAATMLAATLIILALTSGPGTAIWLGICLAAPALPGALLTLARRPHRFTPRVLAAMDCFVRAAAVGLSAALYSSGRITPLLLAACLGLSSLLRPAGAASRFALISGTAPPGQRLRANAVLSVLTAISTIGGPLLGGILASGPGAGSVLAVASAANTLLGLRYLTLSSTPGQVPEPTRGWQLIQAQPALRRVTLLCAICFFLAGPAYVCIPLLPAGSGSPAELAACYSFLGAGAVIGAALSPLAGTASVTRIIRMLPVMFAVPLAVVAAGAAGWPAYLAMWAAGLAFGPWTPLLVTLFQQHLTPAQVTPALATNSAIITIAMPAGILLGGPLAAWAGPTAVLTTAAAAIALAGISIG